MQSVSRVQLPKPPFPPFVFKSSDDCPTFIVNSRKTRIALVLIDEIDMENGSTRAYHHRASNSCGLARFAASNSCSGVAGAGASTGATAAAAIP